MSGLKINQSFNPLPGKREDAVSKAEFNALVSQISLMKQTLERSMSASALTTLITQTVASGGGGSSSGSVVKTVTKSIIAGVASPEVFDAPSLLIGRPIVYTSLDGMDSNEFPVITSETVNGFTATSIQSGTLTYAYVHI